ncbi:Mu transposase C-terminal domain-containing protein [Novosphingobium olei]|uniref:Transposase n=1 Tax=Novosphingobium olei TaxID=2728851 RepID=A0A7Y0GC03_9SPHN|nr:Mu transposase C-terminal domain-containing protein [Novosphingobium olei]NML95137.1 transposase [Novosphingobium olei]
MIERKPHRPKVKSTEALAAGAELYAAFRQHVPLVGKLTASMVAAVSAATGLGDRQVRRLAVRFRADPVAASLAPTPRGPKVGNHRLSPAMRQALEGLISEIYLTKTPPSAALAAREIRGLLIAETGDFRFAPAEVPSERTIVRLIGEISAPQRARASMGSKQRSAHEPHPGAYESSGLLDLVQMDHTRADVILVDSVHRAELGRPWLTLLIEISTRSILGFYVSFGDPSIFRCGRAVANALLPKEPLLRQLGVEVDYPMHGQFKRLHADHAAPHRAESFRRACLANGIDPDIRPRGPAHFGGHIERLIGTMVGKMRLLPGATGSNVTQRDGYDAGQAAAMTIDEFERWLLFQIGIYHNTPHRGLSGRCPAQVWAQETSGGAPLLSAGLDIGHLTRQFLPASELTVHSYGLQLRHRRYWHPLLAPRIGQKITVHRDERTLQEVYADLDGAFLSVPVVGRYPHVTEPEWEAARRRQREEGAAYQADGARAATARYIQAARQEALTARQRTRSTRQERKRQEREGVSHAESARPAADTAAANWIPAAQLPDDGWLQWRD